MEINLHQLEVFASRASAVSPKPQKGCVLPTLGLHSNQESGRLLDVKLLERLGPPVYLTAEGGAVMEHAKKIAEILSTPQSEIRDIKDIRKGKLTAGCSRVPSATRGPLAIAQFKKQYPETEISIKTGRSHEVEQWVLDNEFDVGVIKRDPGSALFSQGQAAFQIVTGFFGNSRPTGDRSMFSACHALQSRNKFNFRLLSPLETA